MKIKTDYVDAGNSVEVPSTIRHPKHYALKGLEPYESIDVIKASLDKGFEHFCVGNILKYILRYKKKNGLEDLKKAKVYLDWAIESLENANDQERV